MDEATDANGIYREYYLPFVQETVALGVQGSEAEKAKSEGSRGEGSPLKPR